jgi:capsular exopolysaccharide synthesis family protein
MDESSKSPGIVSQTKTASRWSAATGELEPVLVNLREPIATVRRHLRLVLGITAAVTLVVGYLAYTATPSYRAVAVIRLSDPRRALTGGVADGPGGGSDSRSVDPLLSQVELLRSRTVAGVVVDSMPVLRVRTPQFPAGLLADVDLSSDVTIDSLQLEFTADSVIVLAQGERAERRAPYGALLLASGISFRVRERPQAAHGTIRVASREAGIGRVIGGLRVTPRPRTDVIDVAYAASDPHRAQQVVNQVVQVFRAVSAAEAQRQSRLRREFLQAQLKINDSVLADVRNALTSFRRRAGRVGSGELAARQQAGVEQPQLQREQLDGDRRVYRQLLATLDNARGEEGRDALRAAVATPGIAGSVVVAQLYSQLVQYENVRDSLTARAPNHPDLPRTRDLIANTETKLLGAVQSAAQGLIGSLDSRIAALDGLRARQTTNAEQLSSTDAEEARLVERVENARQIADQLRMEYQRARIAEAVEVGQVEIVDLAAVPGAPLGIGFAEKMILGLLLGLTLGGGGAFVVSHLGSAIARREDLEALGLQLLSAVPRCKDVSKSQGPGGAEPALEAVRGLRLSLTHAYGAAGPIVFAITSPGSRDGKSFISSNLALAFAHANYRTLLIDGDGRRGTLHRVFKGSRRPGLTDILAGDVEVADAIQTTAYPGLYFIGCGVRRSDGPELLSGERIGALFGFVRSNFTAIVVDTPPLGAGVDAFALATIAGNLLMVLRPGLADRHLVAAKLDLLRRLPIRMLGAVLNDVQAGPEYNNYSYYLEGYEARTEPAERQRKVLRVAR